MITKDQLATIVSIGNAYRIAFDAVKEKIVIGGNHATNQELVCIMSNLIEPARKRYADDDLHNYMQAEWEAAANRVHLSEVV